MEWHSLEIEYIVKQQASDLEQGLSSTAAAGKRVAYGPNTPPEPEPPTPLRLFFTHFCDLSTLMLLAAALVTGVFTVLGEGWSGIIQPLIILAIVVLNAVFGTVQENRALSILHRQGHAAPAGARVIRDGAETSIDSADLVPGDILLLRAGEMVPADARLFRSAELLCDESSFTGSSEPVAKFSSQTIHEMAAFDDRLNMVYAGSGIVGGKAQAIVVATGGDTRRAQAADGHRAKKSAGTPLQQALRRLERILAALALAVALIIFAVGFLYGQRPLDMMLLAVCVAVAAVPEGLHAIFTIAQANSVGQLSRSGITIQNAGALERLADVAVICADKTGLMTEDNYTLRRMWIGGKTVPALGAVPDTALAMLRLAAIALDEKAPFLRSAHAAILAGAREHGLVGEALRAEYPLLAHFPATPDHPLTTVVSRIGGQQLAITVGPLDLLLPCCAGDTGAAVEAGDSFGNEGMEVFGLALKPAGTSEEGWNQEALETGMGFVGLFGLMDPPSADVEHFLAVCRHAGIHLVLFCDEYASVASATGRALGLLDADGEAITGADVSEMPDSRLDRHLTEYPVYTELSCADKIRVIRAWQRTGATVLRIQDGSRPEAGDLLAADIGCTGGRATAFARSASDFLFDELSLSHLTTLLRVGRGMRDNIRKAIQFLLGCNLGEVLCILSAILLGWGSPLLAIQLLLINFVTDGLPALALGFDPPSRDCLSRPPAADSRLFSGGLGGIIALQGAMVGLLTLAAYGIGRFVLKDGTVAQGQTMAFITLAISQLVHLLNVRTPKSIIRMGVRSSGTLWVSLSVSLALMLCVLFLPPMNSLFVIAPLGAIQWTVAIILSCLPLVIIETLKAIRLLLDEWRHDRHAA